MICGPENQYQLNSKVVEERLSLKHWNRFYVGLCKPTLTTAKYSLLLPFKPKYEKNLCTWGRFKKLTAKICFTHGTELGRSVTIKYLIPECHYCSLLTATYKCLFHMQVMHKYGTCTIAAKFIELTAEKFTVSYMNFNLPSRKVQCLVGAMQNQFLTNSRLCS